MRILYMGLGDTPIGRHLPQSWPDRLFRSPVGRHEVLTFGYAEDLDIQVPHDARFEDVLAQLPPGWVPDVCVCVHVDFLVIPPGIENAPFPTVAVTADWDFRIGIARSMAEAFDLTVALGDESCRAMAALGARETLPFAYFGVPEQNLQEPLEEIDRHRPIDVLFTGTIGDGTHLDRSRWLLRLARLSRKYRIHIGEASSAQDSYLELLRRAKLVFTFHRRGEIQLRFTDAVTHGAAVLDNGVQTARHFDAEREFLYYDEENFERLIERHLADGQLRRRTVEGARRRTVREFGSVHRLGLLFDHIEQALAERNFGPRPTCAVPAGERARRIAEQQYANHFDCSMGPSERYLGYALGAAEASTPGARRDNDVAVIGYSIARHGAAHHPAHPDRIAALARFEALTAQHPDYAMGWLNAGYALWSEGRQEEAAACFARTHDLLQGTPDSFDPWALYNHEQHLEPHGFKKAYNDALFALVSTGDGKRARDLVAASALYFLAEFHERQGYLFEAYDQLCAATRLDPDRGEFARRAATQADVLGYESEAREHYERALALLPLDVDWRLSCVGFRARVGDFDRARELLFEAVDLLRAVKGSPELLERTRFLASVLGHMQGGSPVVAGLLFDQFALTALPTLCEKVAATQDPRVVFRIQEILATQGKAEAAARAVAEHPREADLSPGAVAMLAAHRARIARQRVAVPAGT